MSLPDPIGQEVTGAASIFAALGDSTRLALVDRLSTEGPLSITRLTTGSSMTRQAITKHLHVLADARLVRDRRQGREHLWELDPDQLLTARSSLDRISRQWDHALGRLKKFVEE
ncbi:MAG: metalloregulator ArsR/SmtB family transcription factor [Nitrolancea sp.]